LHEKLKICIFRQKKFPERCRIVESDRKITEHKKCDLIGSKTTRSDQLGFFWAETIARMLNSKQEIVWGRKTWKRSVNKYQNGLRSIPLILIFIESKYFPPSGQKRTFILKLCDKIKCYSVRLHALQKNTIVGKYWFLILKMLISVQLNWKLCSLSILSKSIEISPELFKLPNW
jgi:hypothetical protein